MTDVDWSTCAPAYVGRGHTEQEWRIRVQENGYRCHWCGQREGAGNARLTKDHVRPLARGGLDTIANIVPSCQRCNSMKGSMDKGEWLEHCRRISDRWF